jgi:hypothetical protein
VLEIGEGATFRIAPELSDPVGSLEVGEHQDVEKLGAGSGAESVETYPESELQLVGSNCRGRHSRTVVRPSACFSMYVLVA